MKIEVERDDSYTTDINDKSDQFPPISSHTSEIHILMEPPKTQLEESIRSYQKQQSKEPRRVTYASNKRTKKTEL